MQENLKLVKLMDEIEIVRSRLNELVAENEDRLISVEIVSISEMLDQLLTKYNNLK